MFDSLTDLVEYYKRKGIEEMSGNWVQFKQVNNDFFCLTKTLQYNKIKSLIYKKEPRKPHPPKKNTFYGNRESTCP